LAAKWIPREKASAKSKMPFKPLYQALVKEYFYEYFTTVTTPEQMRRAENKGYQHYRQLLSKINSNLKTTQIYQCANKYDEIEYKNVTSVTMRKQTQAFQNKKKNGEKRSDDSNRIQGALNFEQFVTQAKEGKMTIKGKRVGLNIMISDALKMNKSYVCSQFSQIDNDVLNLQWENAGKSIGNLGNIVAMVDLSGSMEGDPMHAAIGLGLRVAEKSKLGRRVLSFSTTPEWINLSGTRSLMDMISTIHPWTDWGMWGGSTNFTAALMMILDACVANKLPAEDVENMVLAIFSDMQIDSFGNESLSQSMWDHITELYSSAGQKAIGTPYKPPHILFWNLRHTDGFPVISEQKGATMFAGFSPALLNAFCNKGIDTLREMTPWSMLQEQLQNERYNVKQFT